jgi:predicted small secreted protein
MKKIFILIAFLLFIIALFSSCNPQTTPKGDYGKVIPQDSMILIIKDIYIVDATLTTAINTRR